MKKLHLKGLDFYRSISVLIVFICHVETFKSRAGLDNFLDLDFFRLEGGLIAIILFFTLSGFLITFILAEKKYNNKDIDIKVFYKRRFLRVFPLYFSVIILSFFIFYLLFGEFYSPSALTLFFTLILAPNISHAFGIGWGLSPQIWTIGTEIQFYLLGPLVVKYFKNLLFITISLFLILSILPHFTLFLINKINPNQELLNLVNRVFFCLKFNWIVCGGVFAIIFVKQYKFIEWINERIILSYFIILFPFILWMLNFRLHYFGEEIYSILFSSSMLIMVSNKNIINLDNKIFSFLNKISYGMYMTHWVVLMILFRTNLFKNFDNGFISNFIIYSLSLGATILLSFLTYYFIEKPFLKIKEKATN